MRNEVLHIAGIFYAQGGWLNGNQINRQGFFCLQGGGEVRLLRKKSRNPSRSVLPLLLWAVLIFFVCLLCGGCEQKQGNIDFTSTQDAYEEKGAGAGTGEGAEVSGLKGREAPLRIAFASVISPIETRKSYQKMVDYIARELGRPAVLVQRKTYEELNMLLAGGEADVAFVSTGAYSS